MGHITCPLQLQQTGDSPRVTTSGVMLRNFLQHSKILVHHFLAGTPRGIPPHASCVIPFRRFSERRKRLRLDIKTRLLKAIPLLWNAFSLNAAIFQFLEL